MDKNQIEILSDSEKMTISCAMCVYVAWRNNKIDELNILKRIEDSITSKEVEELIEKFHERTHHWNDIELPDWLSPTPNHKNKIK